MDTGPAAPGLFDSVRTLLANVVALAHTRVELLGTELREEMARTGVMLLAALSAWFFGALGIAFTALAIIFAAGEGHRLAAAVTLAVLFFCCCAAGIWALRRVAILKPRAFDASLSELRRDYELIKPRS